MNAAAGPQVGMTVQFLERPISPARAAIVVGVFRLADGTISDRLDLAVWGEIRMGQATFKMGWIEMTSIPPFNPNAAAAGWRPIEPPTGEWSA